MRAKVEAADAVFPRALKTPPENEINLVGASGRRKVRQWREPAACNFRYRGRFSRMRRLNRGSAARGKMTSGAKTAAAGPFLGAFSCWPLPQAVFGLTIGPFGIGAATASYCRSPTKGLRRDSARLCLAMPAMSVANLTCSRATLF